MNSLLEIKNLAVCPLKKELQGLVSGLEKVGVAVESLSKNSFFISEFNTLIALGGHSKSEFAAQTSKLIAELKPSLRVFCLGVAGSLVDSVAPLDVVVGQSTIEHDFKSGFGESDPKLPEFKSKVIDDDNLFAKKWMRGLGSQEFQVHVAKVASGNEDIVTVARAAEISKLTGCKAVAWEGAGGARAAKAWGLEFLEIRAISDRCDEHVESQFFENLAPAMENLAAVFASMLKRLPS